MNHTKSSNRKLKVALLWHSLDSDNLGVGALAIGHINIISNVAKEKGLEVEFTTVGTPNSTKKNARDAVNRLLGYNIDHIIYSPREIVSNIAKLNFSQAGLFSKFDLVFDIGEGDSFTDIYGSSRFIRLLASKLHVILNKTPLVIAPQTIGPFEKTSSNIMAKYVLKCSSNVFIRDKKSREVFSKLLPKAASTQVIDVAFAMPFEANESIEDKTVGINISGLLYNGGYTGENQFSLRTDYKTLVNDLIEYFLDKTNYKVELVSHVISDDQPWEDDYKTCVEVASNYDNVTVGPKFSNPIEAKSHISGYSLFLGSRMHATIAAFSTGVPVIPLAYSRKFEGLFTTLGYPHSLDLKSMSSEQVLIEIDTKLKNIDSLKLDLKSSSSLVESLLDDYKAGLYKILE